MINRRRLVAAVSGLSLLTLAALAAIAVALATQTAFGRDQLRGLMATRLAGAVTGKAYLGRLTELGLGYVAVDSIEIRDAADSLFVASGPIAIVFDPRDLINARLRLRSIVAEHPVVRIRRYENDDWNFRQIFHQASAGRGRSAPGFGDYIVLDSTVVHDGRVSLTLPWHPDDTLHGAKRDSAVRVTLGRTDKEVRRTRDGKRDGFGRTWRWTGIEAYAPRVRLADPDSAGRAFTIADLRFNENDPPFAFRNVNGTVRWRGDSIWLQAPHWDLPGSTGSAHGKIWWGNDLPVRYAVHVVGDSVSLRDVAWVYPTLPHSGGGRMDLDIRNAPGNLNVIDYVIRGMDVQTTHSHLTGEMTYGVGGPILVVKDVNVVADPLDFAFLHMLNGKPLPVDWEGQLRGTVRARGGPLTRFVVDEARGTFADAHVRGALSRFSATGGLDILDPALTKFRGLAVNAERLDLRTIEFLYPAFPRLSGTVSGTATLDSSWLDVRFSNASITHRDGDALPSHATGSGRVTWGSQFLTYDVDLDAEPLSLTLLARSYPRLRLRGPVAGPIRAKGTIANLAVTTTLSGAAGTASFDGIVDADPPTYALRGSGSFAGLDLQTLFDTTAAPRTALTAGYRIDAAGASLADFAGSLALTVAPSRVAGIRVFPSVARLRFAGGILTADSVAVRTEAGVLAVSGSLGLSGAHLDTLRFVLVGDSLGGFASLRGDGESASRDHDPIGGRYSARGILVGSLDSLAKLDTRGTVEGHDFVVGATRIQGVTGEFSLRDVLRSPGGDVRLSLDTVAAWGTRMTSATATAHVFDATHARFGLALTLPTGPRVTASADVREQGQVVTALLDTLDLAIEDRRWGLLRPARATAGAAGVVLDGLALRGPRGARFVAGGDLPVAGPSRVAVTADSIPLRDIGLLAELRDSLAGRGSLRWELAGERRRPTMSFSAALTDAAWGDARAGRLALRGTYAKRQLAVAADLYRDDQAAVRATVQLPVDLALVTVPKRLLDDSLRGMVRADSVDLAVIEAVSNKIQGARGRLAANLTLGGTWTLPTLSGRLRVTDGQAGLRTLGIRIEGIDADVEAVNDSLRITTFRARSGAQAGNYAALSGTIDLHAPTNPVFDLRFDSRDFRIVSDPQTAELDLTAHVALVGPYRAATVGGLVTVPRGSVFVPEFTRKRVIDENDPEFREVLDTTDVASRELLPAASSAFVQNLVLSGMTIQLGQDVWLRSPDANIQLGGSIGLTTDSTDIHGRRAGMNQYKLALNGELSADRGTYRLNLGLVARTFQVERGTIRFNGTADLNPDLDIRALYTVREQQQQQQGIQDVRIRVAITGTLANPQLSLASADGLPYSQADLFSYLITGRQNFDLSNLAGAGSAATTGFSVLLPTATTIVEQALQSQFGRGVDFLSVETGTRLNANGGLNTLSTLQNTRVGVGKQLTDRTYATLTAGVCPLTSTSSGGAGSNLSDALGIKVEHRLNFGFSVEASVEPTTATGAACAVQTRTFTVIPKQYGFDLFRTWSF